MNIDGRLNKLETKLGAKEPKPIAVHYEGENFVTMGGTRQLPLAEFHDRYPRGLLIRIEYTDQPGGTRVADIQGDADVDSTDIARALVSYRRP